MGLFYLKYQESLRTLRSRILKIGLLLLIVVTGVFVLWAYDKADTSMELG